MVKSSHDQYWGSNFKLYPHLSLTQVVSYLKDNLSEKNVLLVLQHICFYCSSSAENPNNLEDGTFWNVPVTEPPKSSRLRSEKDSFVPSAPPPDQV